MMIYGLECVCITCYVYVLSETVGNRTDHATPAFRVRQVESKKREKVSPGTSGGCMQYIVTWSKCANAAQMQNLRPRGQAQELGQEDLQPRPKTDDNANGKGKTQKGKMRKHRTNLETSSEQLLYSTQ